MLLEHEVALAGAKVDRVVVFVGAPRVRRIVVVLARVGADREVVVRRDIDGAQRLVRQLHELVVGETILRQVVERAILRFLHDLLRLQPRILDVPENERRILLRRIVDARLVDRAAHPRSAGLDHRAPAPGEQPIRRLLRFVNSEIDRRQVFGEPRRTIHRDRHVFRELGVCRRVEHGLLRSRRRNAGERDDRVDRVTSGRIDAAAEHGERVEAVRPDEVPIQRPIRVDGTHDVGLHVAQLNAVADRVARVDRVRQPIAAVVKSELGDVADVHRLAVGEVVEQQIRALGTAGRRGGTRGSSTASRGAVRRVACRSGRSFRRRLNREPGRLVAVERVASHAVEFFLLTRREIDQRQLVLRRRRLRGAIGRLSPPPPPPPPRPPRPAPPRPPRPFAAGGYTVNATQRESALIESGPPASGAAPPRPPPPPPPRPAASELPIGNVNSLLSVPVERMITFASPSFGART